MNIFSAVSESCHHGDPEMFRIEKAVLFSQKPIHLLGYKSFQGARINSHERCHGHHMCHDDVRLFPRPVKSAPFAFQCFKIIFREITVSVSVKFIDFIRYLVDVFQHMPDVI